MEPGGAGRLSVPRFNRGAEEGPPSLEATAWCEPQAERLAPGTETTRPHVQMTMRRLRITDLVIREGTW